MSDEPDGTTPFDLTTTHLHLSTDASTHVLPGFQWSPDYLDAYTERFAGDGPAGRLVMFSEVSESWSSWEVHPAGEEVVVLLSGRVDLVQQIDGAERRTPLVAGQTVLNPPGVWHSVDVHEPGRALFITPGLGTEHKPR